MRNQEKKEFNMPLKLTVALVPQVSITFKRTNWECSMQNLWDLLTH